MLRFWTKSKVKWKKVVPSSVCSNFESVFFFSFKVVVRVYLQVLLRRSRKVVSIVPSRGQCEAGVRITFPYKDTKETVASTRINFTTLFAYLCMNENNSKCHFSIIIIVIN